MNRLARRSTLGAAAPVLSYHDTVLADSPTSYWRLDDPSGTTAADVMGAHAGTYVGAPTLGATGRMSGNAAVTFNGTSQSVDTGNLALFGAGDCTYELWVKATGLTGNQYIFSEGNTGGAGAPFVALQTANSIVTFAARNDAATFAGGIGGTTNIGTGAWFYLAVTKSGSTTTMYVNGVAEGTPGTTSGAYTCNKSRIATLARQTDGQWFPGTIDEVAVYNHALTAGRVAAHFAAAA